MQNNDYQILKDTLEHLLNFYKDPRDELNKIFLINSWNEWGENMAIEPSNECSLYYLELINTCLKNVFKN